MSYDLYFQADAIDFAQIEHYFSNRLNYKVANQQAWYSNEKTGVYFYFEWNEPKESGKSDGDIEIEHPIAFNLNYFRPHVFALPYKGFSYTMFVLLPEKHSTLASQLALLTTDRWAAIKSTIKGRRGELFLPKFEFDFDSSLSDTLQQLGMKDCFDLKKADFSATLDTADKTLPEPACLDDVIQKTTIRVDEYGTEAASSVAGAYYIAGGPREEQPFVMKVDHPFLFVLEDNLTREIVFVGKVEDP